MKQSPFYQEILQEGGQEGTITIAGNLLATGLPIADVARCTGLSPEDLNAIQSQTNTAPDLEID